MPIKVFKVKDKYIVKDVYGHVYGKHATKAAALRQKRAIYANKNKKK